MLILHTIRAKWSDHPWVNVYKLSDIRDIHLEISSLCNARCPLCPRNFHGYPYNDGYIERNLTLDDVKKIFKPTFLSHIDTMAINGNFGDFVMNPESIDIVRYFKEYNIDIGISTNGSARTKNFWKELAKLDCLVFFCLDGLEDTHTIYRQDTVFKTIINNAKTFMKAGGCAVWKMIKFDHNKHQIAECQKLSKKLGFSNFEIQDDDRDTGPAVDKKGNVVHFLGTPKLISDVLLEKKRMSFNQLLEKKKNDTVLLEDINATIKKNIKCKVKKQRSVFVASTGEVYPCCWTGFSPRTYGDGQYYEVVNAQLKDIITPNNALERPLEECIKWFDDVEQSWNIDKFEDGRLVVCNDVCGGC